MIYVFNPKRQQRALWWALIIKTHFTEFHPDADFLHHPLPILLKTDYAQPHSRQWSDQIVFIRWGTVELARLAGADWYLPWALSS